MSTRIYAFLFLLCTALVLQGCALRVPSSRGGRSGFNQLMESQTLRDALKNVAWSTSLNGRRIYVDARGMDEGSIAPDFLRLAVERSMIEAGLRPIMVPEREDAEVIVLAQLESLGTDSYLPSVENIVTYLLMVPIRVVVNFEFYSRSVARVKILAYAPREQYQEDQIGTAKTTFGQFRILMVIGPFKMGNMESVK